MKIPGLKGVVFALIAAGIGGAVSEGVERGLNYADARLHAGNDSDNGEDETEEETTEE